MSRTVSCRSPPGWRAANSTDRGDSSSRGLIVDAGMVFDPDTKRVILFGGRSADGKTADLPAQTWAYTP
jgi:hypothetical protein